MKLAHSDMASHLKYQVIIYTEGYYMKAIIFLLCLFSFSAFAQDDFLAKFQAETYKNMQNGQQAALDIQLKQKQIQQQQELQMLQLKQKQELELMKLKQQQKMNEQKYAHQQTMNETQMLIQSQQIMFNAILDLTASSGQVRRPANNNSGRVVVKETKPDPKTTKKVVTTTNSKAKKQ